jgi:HSP20 family protein
LPKKTIAKEKPEEKLVPVATPEACIDHDEEAYYIQVELPGVKKENVSLSMTEQSFCIQGTRENLVFAGCFILAHPVKEDEAKAKFENGLLNITVPLKQPLKGKKIPIE